MQNTFDKVKQQAIDDFQQTAALIESSRSSIDQFDEICRQLREKGLQFKVHTNAWKYDVFLCISLDTIESRTIGDLLIALANMGFEETSCHYSETTRKHRIDIISKSGLQFSVSHFKPQPAVQHPHPHGEVGHADHIAL